MIGIEVKQSEITAINKSLKRVSENIFDKRVMAQILVKVKENIRKRTETGVDVNLKPFKPYNSKYAAKKKKTRVDLTDTGRMLNALTQKVINNDTGRIFLQNSRYKGGSDVHTVAAKNEETRKFFGYNSGDEKFVRDSYQKVIDSAVRQFNSGS